MFLLLVLPWVVLGASSSRETEQNEGACNVTEVMDETGRGENSSTAASGCPLYCGTAGDGVVALCADADQVDVTQAEACLPCSRRLYLVNFRFWPPACRCTVLEYAVMTSQSTGGVTFIPQSCRLRFKDCALAHKLPAGNSTGSGDNRKLNATRADGLATPGVRSAPDRRRQAVQGPGNPQAALVNEDDEVPKPGWAKISGNASHMVVVGAVKQDKGKTTKKGKVTNRQFLQDIDSLDTLSKFRVAEDQHENNKKKMVLEDEARALDDKLVQAKEKEVEIVKLTKLSKKNQQPNVTLIVIVCLMTLPFLLAAVCLYSRRLRRRRKWEPPAGTWTGSRRHRLRASISHGFQRMRDSFRRQPEPSYDVYTTRSASSTLQLHAPRPQQATAIPTPVQPDNQDQQHYYDVMCEDDYSSLSTDGQEHVYAPTPSPSPQAALGAAVSGSRSLLSLRGCLSALGRQQEAKSALHKSLSSHCPSPARFFSPRPSHSSPAVGPAWCSPRLPPSEGSALYETAIPARAGAGAGAGQAGSKGGSARSLRECPSQASTSGRVSPQRQGTVEGMASSTWNAPFPVWKSVSEAPHTWQYPEPEPARKRTAMSTPATGMVWSPPRTAGEIDSSPDRQAEVPARICGQCSDKTLPSPASSRTVSQGQRTVDAVPTSPASSRTVDAVPTSPASSRTVDAVPSHTWKEPFPPGRSVSDSWYIWREPLTPTSPRLSLSSPVIGDFLLGPSRPSSTAGCSPGMTTEIAASASRSGLTMKPSVTESVRRADDWSVQAAPSVTWRRPRIVCTSASYSPPEEPTLAPARGSCSSPVLLYWTPPPPPSRTGPSPDLAAETVTSTSGLGSRAQSSHTSLHRQPTMERVPSDTSLHRQPTMECVPSDTSLHRQPTIEGVPGGTWQRPHTAWDSLSDSPHAGHHVSTAPRASFSAPASAPFWSPLHDGSTSAMAAEVSLSSSRQDIHKEPSSTKSVSKTGSANAGAEAGVAKSASRTKISRGGLHAQPMMGGLLSGAWDTLAFRSVRPASSDTASAWQGPPVSASVGPSLSTPVVGVPLSPSRPPSRATSSNDTVIAEVMSTRGDGVSKGPSLSKGSSRVELHRHPTVEGASSTWDRPYTVCYSKSYSPAACHDSHQPPSNRQSSSLPTFWYPPQTPIPQGAPPDTASSPVPRLGSSGTIGGVPSSTWVLHHPVRKSMSSTPHMWHEFPPPKTPHTAFSSPVLGQESPAHPTHPPAIVETVPSPAPSLISTAPVSVNKGTTTAPSSERFSFPCSLLQYPSGLSLLSLQSFDPTGREVRAVPHVLDVPMTVRSGKGTRSEEKKLHESQSSPKLSPCSPARSFDLRMSKSEARDVAGLCSSGQLKWVSGGRVDWVSPSPSPAWAGSYDALSAEGLNMSQSASSQEYMAFSDPRTNKNERDSFNTVSDGQGLAPPTGQKGQIDVFLAGSEADVCTSNAQESFPSLVSHPRAGRQQSDPSTCPNATTMAVFDVKNNVTCPVTARIHSPLRATDFNFRTGQSGFMSGTSVFLFSAQTREDTLTEKQTLCCKEKVDTTQHGSEVAGLPLSDSRMNGESRSRYRLTARRRLGSQPAPSGKSLDNVQVSAGQQRVSSRTSKSHPHPCVSVNRITQTGLGTLKNLKAESSSSSAVGSLDSWPIARKRKSASHTVDKTHTAVSRDQREKRCCPEKTLARPWPTHYTSKLSKSECSVDANRSVSCELDTTSSSTNLDKIVEAPFMPTTKKRKSQSNVSDMFLEDNHFLEPCRWSKEPYILYRVTGINKKYDFETPDPLASTEGKESIAGFTSSPLSKQNVHDEAAEPNVSHSNRGVGAVTNAVGSLPEEKNNSDNFATIFPTFESNTFYDQRPINPTGSSSRQIKPAKSFRHIIPKNVSFAIDKPGLKKSATKNQHHSMQQSALQDRIPLQLSSGRKTASTGIRDFRRPVSSREKAVQSPSPCLPAGTKSAQRARIPSDQLRFGDVLPFPQQRQFLRPSPWSKVNGNNKFSRKFNRSSATRPSTNARRAARSPSGDHCGCQRTNGRQSDAESAQRRNKDPRKAEKGDKLDLSTLTPDDFGKLSSRTALKHFSSIYFAKYGKRPTITRSRSPSSTSSGSGQNILGVLFPKKDPALLACHARHPKPAGPDNTECRAASLSPDRRGSPDAADSLRVWQQGRGFSPPTSDRPDAVSSRTQQRVASPPTRDELNGHRTKACAFPLQSEDNTRRLPSHKKRQGFSPSTAGRERTDGRPPQTSTNQRTPTATTAGVSLENDYQTPAKRPNPTFYPRASHFTGIPSSYREEMPSSGIARSRTTSREGSHQRSLDRWDSPERKNYSPVTHTPTAHTTAAPVVFRMRSPSGNYIPSGSSRPRSSTQFYDAESWSSPPRSKRDQFRKHSLHTSSTDRLAAARHASHRPNPDKRDPAKHTGHSSDADRWDFTKHSTQGLDPDRWDSTTHKTQRLDPDRWDSTKHTTQRLDPERRNRSKHTSQSSDPDRWDSPGRPRYSPVPHAHPAQTRTSPTSAKRIPDGSANPASRSQFHDAASWSGPHRHESEHCHKHPPQASDQNRLGPAKTTPQASGPDRQGPAQNTPLNSDPDRLRPAKHPPRKDRRGPARHTFNSSDPSRWDSATHTPQTSRHPGGQGSAQNTPQASDPDGWGSAPRNCEPHRRSWGHVRPVHTTPGSPASGPVSGARAARPKPSEARWFNNNAGRSASSDMTTTCTLVSTADTQAVLGGDPRGRSEESRDAELLSDILDNDVLVAVRGSHPEVRSTGGLPLAHTRTPTLLSQRGSRGRQEAMTSDGGKTLVPRAAARASAEDGRKGVPFNDRGLGTSPPTFERLRTSPPNVGRLEISAPIVERLGTSLPTEERLGTSPPTVERPGISPPTVERLRTSPPTVERLGTSPPTVEKLGISPPPVERLRTSALIVERLETGRSCADKARIGDAEAESVSLTLAGPERPNAAMACASKPRPRLDFQALEGSSTAVSGDAPLPAVVVGPGDSCLAAEHPDPDARDAKTSRPVTRQESTLPSSSSDAARGPASRAKPAASAGGVGNPGRSGRSGSRVARAAEASRGFAGASRTLSDSDRREFRSSSSCATPGPGAPGSGVEEVSPLLWRMLLELESFFKASS